MFFEYPTGKSYRFVIKTQYGDLILTYKQATAQQTVDYLEIFDEQNYIKKAEKVGKYRQEFIKNNTKSYKKKRFISKTKVTTEALLKLEEYVDELVHSYHKQRKSIYSGKPRAHQKDAKPNYFDNTPFIISKNTGVHINDIYNTFTFEQVQWMQDKFLHDYYRTFKNGEKINYMVRDVPKTEEGKKKIEIEAERIRKAMPKNLYGEKTDPKTWRR